MRRNVRIVSLIFSCLLLTSCVDYVQSITYKNGKYHMYYKITLSKLIFAMGDQDPDEVFKEFDEEEIGELPLNAKVKTINTDIEGGYEFSFEIDPRTTDKTEKSFLPKVAGKKCFIPFLLGDNETIADSVEKESDNNYGEAFAEAIMSSAKCRILISKGVLPSIETAYFEGKGNQNYSIPVFDYGDDYCLEIPVIILLQKGMYRTDRVVVIRK